MRNIYIIYKYMSRGWLFVYVDSTNIKQKTFKKIS